MVDKKIIDYIKSSLKIKKTKEEIYLELLGKGWKVSDIEVAFIKASGKAVPVLPTPFSVEKEQKSEEDIQKRTITIIVTIGAILVGAGIFSFIAANWTHMSKFIKVLIIIISMLSAYSAGWFFREKKDLPKIGQAFLLLGAIIYGAGIFLVAQMFNIRATWPDGFILWMLGVILMGFMARSFPLLVLSIPLGATAIIGHPISIFIFFYRDPFLLTSSFLIFITVVATFVAGWNLRKEMPEEFKKYY